jgi:dienelactone hydrolase
MGVSNRKQSWCSTHVRAALSEGELQAMRVTQRKHSAVVVFGLAFFAAVAAQPTQPLAGKDKPAGNLVLDDDGLHDYDTGLDMATFQVVADFALDGVAVGRNLAPEFKAKTPGVWELTLSRPLTQLPRGKLTISVKGRQGNVTRIERTLSVVAKDRKIQREKLSLAGWDPDEPVPAYLYYKKGNKSMPVVIFMHGLGGSKEENVEHMQQWADKGLFVVALDAHLHGERKVPGMFPQGKNLGGLGTDYSIWVHQSAVSHTARDVSKVIDALSARPEVDLSRIGVAGVSMGGSTCMVLAWKEPRISVVVGLIGAVDFWYDVTKTPPGKDQDAKRKALSLRVRQLVSSLDPQDRKPAIAPKALLLANGARDDGIAIASIKQFVKDLRPSYKTHPDRLELLEEPKTGHTVTERMWKESTRWLLCHLVEKPIRSPASAARKR